MKNQVNILLGSVLMLWSCEESYTKFRSSLTPCHECTAVKTVNKQTQHTVYFDDKNTMTLRAPMYEGHDSLIITRNGVVVVALPNFKHVYAMDDKKRRNLYYKSTSNQGVKSMRFHYPKEGEFRVVTSQVIDGEYNINKDTMDVYYRLIR